ncbi:MAG: NPCBM/NEW2 domain-containing protein [Planctomycetales bacterium]|nr:NPCBM/NEW2 domain-containing protein [Planctomycetales bacterium]
MRTIVAVIFLTLATSTAQASVPVSIAKADGTVVRGEFQKCDADTLHAKVDSESQAFPLDQVKSVRFESADNPSKPFAKVFLTDGTQINCAKLRISGGVAKCEFAGTRLAEIPTSDINYVRLAPFRDAVDAEWVNVLAAARVSDQMVVRRNNNAIDYLDGVLGDMTDESVQFEYDDEVIDVKFARIDGFVFFRNVNAKFPRPACTVETTTGSKIAGDAIVADQRQAVVKTLTGHDLKLPLASLSNISFTNRSSIFLSEVKPERVSWQPDVPSTSVNDFAEFFMPRKDRGFRDKQLSLMVDREKRDYKKGIAASSHSELTYRLASDYRKFTAMVGIDPGVAPSGEARLEIWADSKKVFDRLLTGSEDATPVDIDLTGVGRMRIVVGRGEILSDGDFINLCDARLMK